MVDPSAVNYIKEQLHAGYTKDEIRKALLDSGWNEKDIEDAFYVIYGESKEINPQKEPGEPSIGFYGGPDQAESEPQQYESPWNFPEKKDEKEREETMEPTSLEEPQEKPLPQEEPKYERLEDHPLPKLAADEKPHPRVKKSEKEPSSIRIGPYVSMFGGVMILANFLLTYFWNEDILAMVWMELKFLSVMTPEIVQIIALSVGAFAILAGMLVKMNPTMDIYFGLVLAMAGMLAFLSGSGYIIGGVICIASGSFLIIRQ
jgi:hypothetical protein